MKDRTETFARNPRLEVLLRSLNERLEPAGSAVASQFKSPKYPVILIVGCARSGTTLLMQWMANLGLFCFPTNLVSRFYTAPSIGLQIQNMLLDQTLAFGQEMTGVSSHEFNSALGKTTGWLAPNEFWYFWRRFFIETEDQSSAQFVSRERFLADLAGLESEARRPLALKAMIANWWIEELNRILDKVVFVHLRRDVRHTAQSLLESREKHSGTINNWYSFKPPEYPRLKNLDPLRQVVGQVIYTQQAVDGALKKIDPARFLVLQYEEFCARPEEAYLQLKSRMEAQAFGSFPPSYPVSHSFSVQNECRMSVEKWQQLAKIIEEYQVG